MAEMSSAHALLAGRPFGKAANAMPVPALRAAALPSPIPAFAAARERPTLDKVASRTAPLRVLVVEDDPLVRQACADIARDLGYLVETADSVPTARLALKRTAADVLLLDLKLPGGGGFTLLEEIRVTHPRTAAVVMTAFASVPSAVEAMRTGAGDYLAKPFTLEELTAVLERAAERRHAFAEARVLRDRLHTGKASILLMGQDPAMDKLRRILSKVAFTSHPVLILGESGTGKEMVARTIHSNGPTAARPFIPVDCGSLQPALLERELFGSVAGQPTPGPGSRAKAGLLAAAEGGTVFLDEIGDLTPELQARLLRALQEKEVRPVNSESVMPMRARVLAATNRDLAAMVESGRFRKDLYYRLNVVNMCIPPLRERPGDIPLLATYLLDRFSRERDRLENDCQDHDCQDHDGQDHDGQDNNHRENDRREHSARYILSDEALRLMIDYDWPGNVRELEHAMERACSLSSGPVLHLADLPLPLQQRRYQARLTPAELRSIPPEARDDVMTGVVTIVELEKQAILKALRQLQGDKLLAAKLLGIGKTTLYRKLKEYGLGDDLLTN